MAQNPSEMNKTTDPNRDISDESIDQLKADIENTRAAMSETIDAIQEKIDPRRVASRARTEISDKIRARFEPLGYTAQATLNQAAAGVRGLSDRLAEKVRDNPDDLPKWGAMALAGVGALALAIAGLKKLRGRER